MVWILRQILHQPVTGEEDGEDGQQEKLVVEPKAWRLNTGDAQSTFAVPRSTLHHWHAPLCEGSRGRSIGAVGVVERPQTASGVSPHSISDTCFTAGEFCIGRNREVYSRE
jgi:hypothetical protein